MANIIYAPIIGETIPGFVTDTENIVLKTIEHKKITNIGDWQYRSQNIDIKNKTWRNIEITIEPDSPRGKLNNRPLLQVGYLEGLHYIETQNYNLPLSAEEYKNLNNKIPNEATNAYILVYYQNEQEQIAEPEYKISLLKPSQIKIPFQMSSAVSQVDINGFSLKVSDYNGNELEGSPLELKKDDWENIKDISYLEFNQRAINFDPNQYYKFQLAYIGKGESEGEKHNRKYSYVSIGKCVGEAEDFEVQINAKPHETMMCGIISGHPYLSEAININKTTLTFANIEKESGKYNKITFWYYQQKEGVGFIETQTYDFPITQNLLKQINNKIPENADNVRLEMNNNSSNWKVWYINPPDDNKNNFNIFNYDGKFKRNVMEPLYSYRYDFRDKNSGELLQSTDEILWNVDKDKKFEDNYLSDLDDFKLSINLDEDKIYTLQLFCTTVNGYEITSPVYEIIKEKEVGWESGVLDKFEVFQDYIGKENGYIQFDATFKKGGINKVKLERQEDEGLYETVYTFDIKQAGPFKISWKDQAIKQGVNYKYALRYWVEGEWCWTYRAERGPIFVDFDHVFLSDSERQLKIKFDPKVSSFRDTLLEQKTDTIGSRYPFFFRNNQIKYKEIPISGLISYHMDNDEFFMKQEDLGLNKIQNRSSTAAAGSYDSDPATEKPKISTPATTDLVDYNIAAERKFKLEVLDWLNNGKPKLFRSPTEGNYVIRLMNVSLSPNDTLGRAIHSFSATGYECMDNDPQTLMENGLLGYKETDITSFPVANLGLLTLGIAQLGQGWAQKEGTNNEQ